MTLSAWTSLLCDELSKQMAQPIEPQTDSSRFERITRPLEPQPENDCFYIGLGEYGLHVMADDAEVLVWLLDAAGRTSGPIWCSEMTAQSTCAAATEIARATKEAPRDRSFTAWPPTRRDATLEATVNALWQNVQSKLDTLEIASLDELGIRRAIESVDRFIDDLARNSATIAEYAVPFKAMAADVVRSRTKAASSDTAN